MRDLEELLIILNEVSRNSNQPSGARAFPYTGIIAVFQAERDRPVGAAASIEETHLTGY